MFSSIDLVALYKLYHQLQQLKYGSWSEFDNLKPYEFDLYCTQLNEDMKKKAENKTQ